MTDHLTTIFCVAVALLVIVYDIWIDITRGGNSTVSWTFASWCIVHPSFLIGMFTLAGHMMLPGCAPLGENTTQSIPSHFGIALGVVACVGILMFGAYMLRQPRQETFTVSKSYLCRMAAFAVLGLFLGHTLFTQYVTCSP